MILMNTTQTLVSVVKMLRQDEARLEREGLTGELTTSQVASFFRTRAPGIPDYCQDYPDTMAPSSSQSFARVTMGGDLPSRCDPTDDEGNSSGYYDWYDLEEVPLYGIVFRVTCMDTLYLFVRRDRDYWLAYCVCGLPQ